jgi:type III restriction enzyme
LNVLRNLSDEAATKAIVENFKYAVNALTVHDKGTTEVRDHIQFRKTRPFLVNDQAYVVPKKSIFNKVVGDSHFELEFAAFLDGCDDIVSFIKNSQSTYFKVEYRNADGGIANYYPDFIVKESESDLWIIETKGKADLDVPLKWERLVNWCQDASVQSGKSIKPLYVLQTEWDKYRPKSFSQLCSTFIGSVPEVK